VLQESKFKTLETASVLSNLLTVHGAFSAILITYLFSRITWLKERKFEVYKEAISISQKVTEYRRILNKLTSYYQVWQSDKATKSLLEHGKFKHIDFCDFKYALLSDNKPANKELVYELNDHPDFKEGQSQLYLAMLSLVRNRKSTTKEYPEELYKDFSHNGIYNIEVVGRWLDCGVFSSIWYWLDKEYSYINYSALRNDREYILAAAGRINKKYEGYELDNKLLKELADDFHEHYLVELYQKIRELKEGATGLNLLILALITVSLIFGVLSPFTLVLLKTEALWFLKIVAMLSSINAGLIAYFTFRFPVLVNNELKLT
jgi:hypothetical protein